MLTARVTIEGESELLFLFIEHKKMPVFISHRVVYKCTRLKVQGRILTINFCLSHEKPKGNVCLFHTSLYVQYDIFSYGRKFTENSVTT